MLYRIVRPLAKLAISAYFKKIYLSNIKNLPLDKPVILACNHPTAFVEPCLLACWLPKSLNFLARGDFFMLPIVPHLLRSLHIIPIFRMRDGGYGKLKNNYESFKECHRAFAQNKIVLIMSEGNTVHEKRLRPIQKGTARLAFGALENDENLDLKIIPIGINFTKSEEFRRRAMINFGKPISVKEYFPDYKENNAKGIKELTKKLETELTKSVVHIPENEHQDLIDFLLTLEEGSFQETIFPKTESNKVLLDKQLHLIQKINALSDQDQSNFLIKVKDLAKHFNNLKINELYFNSSPTKTLKKWGIVLTIPLFIISFLLNFIPFLSAKKIAEKLFPKDLTFQTPMKIFLLILTYSFWMILFAILFPFEKLGIPIWSIILVPILGKFALIYFDEMKKWLAQMRYEKLPEVVKNDLKKRWENLRQVWA